MLDRSSVSRRRFLAGIASTAIVVGFDPVQRAWVSAAEASQPGACSEWPDDAQLPCLDGVLYTDLATRQEDSTDKGNIAQALPCAVLRPGSVQDIQEMVKFCRAHHIKVATRGQHHSMHGQGLTCGLIIENRWLDTIHSIGPEGAVVDAGVTWKELTQAAFAQGLRPRGLTGYAGLSIGGTLSVGGCPLSNTQGALVDHVQALTVVTGKGQVKHCSEHHNEDLFEAVLGGLGQCAIITRAKVDLVPALPMARTYLLAYTDLPALFQDMRTLIDRGELDEVYALSPGMVFLLNATIFFDPSDPPDDGDLLRDLTVPPSAASIVDQGYVDYALAVDTQIDFLREFFGWDQLIKPWHDVWLPDAVVEEYVGDVVAGLGPDDIGPFGFVLLFAQKRSEMNRPFLRVPGGGGGCGDDDDEWVWLFDIATASAAPGPNPQFVTQMLNRNRQLFDWARDLGGTRYPIGAVAFQKSDWIQHYGEMWHEFKKRKKHFDPSNILTPGPGIF